jgi:steroid delta-isomerase-like uncharacterized protein
VADDPKAIVQAFVKEVQNDGNIDAAGKYIAEDYVEHSPMPGTPSGLDGAKSIFSMIRAGLPDHDAVIHDQVVEGDKVVTRKSFNGTHKGEFLGVPATGKPVTIDVIDIVRVNNGKIVEHWNIVDVMSVMHQIGALPGGE